MKTKKLSIEIDTLVELTPETAQQVNGGFKTVSSPMPGPQPTPPVHKHHHVKHHQTVSSVKPI